ncbi:MAG: hypothetical protein IZT55_05120 [Anaerolineae bacterium]|nr:hypothetical protein [Anaerolineae bacterium]
MCLIYKPVFSADDGSIFGITNFAFSNYLGTGFYTTSEHDVFVIQLPIDYTIIEKTDSEAGWVLNLPITIGFINFDNLKLEDLPEIDDVTTLSFVPGIEYHYPVSPDWTIIPFADYGFARDFNHTSNVLITGIGVKSYANFHLNETVITLGNRFLHARERSDDSNDASDHVLIETGLNYRLTNNRAINTNLYYVNYYYPDSLVFFDRTPNPIIVGVANEIGVTFSNLPDFLFFDSPELGIGVRFSGDVDILRIVFGSPF